MLQKEIEKYDDIVSQLNGALVAIFTKLQLKKEVIGLYDECGDNTMDNCKIEGVLDTGVMFKDIDSEKRVFIKYCEFLQQFICRSNSGKYELNCNTNIY